MTRRRLAFLLVLGAILLGTPAFAVGTAAQQSWHADQARIPEARAAGRGGADVIVAVLDSWIDGAHPDFEGRVLPGADCLRATCRPGPASSDACDHGTHVAGTVAASSFGVATKARILPVRVLAFDAESQECVGRPDDVAAGIRWAVANGARVLNLSLGPDVPGLAISPSILRAVDAAANAGAVVVFSAGNASVPITDAYGSSALIVAATGPDGSLASYSQRGAGVDLAAPGGDPRTPGVCTQQDCVTSLFPNARYSVAAGTSMAAPHVSGVAALLFAQDPARTRDQVVERMLSTARPLADAGHGLLDAQAALGVGPNQPTIAQAGAPPEQVTAPAPPTPAPPPAASPAPAPATFVAAPVAPPAAVPAATPPVGATAAPAPEDPAAVPAKQLLPVAAPGAPTVSVPVPIWTATLAAVLLLLAGGGTVAASRGYH